jgi:hypothetical protein
VYQLTCRDCNKKYIGQTDRPFHIRFKEHVTDYRYENNESNFAKYLIENKHTLNSTEDAMIILHTTIKGRMLNTLEEFYIYGETKNNNQLNDRHTVTPNAIFDTVLLNSSDRALKVK